MMAADGLLLRVRTRAGRLTSHDLRALARIASAHGDGAVGLTRRGKIEIRGVRDGEAALAALRKAGLVRNDSAPDLLVSPAGDLDSSAQTDVTATAEAVSAALHQDPRFQDLPAKTAIVLDGGGRAHLGDNYGDLRIDAVGGAASIALAGTAQTARPLGLCSLEAVPAVAAALLLRFLRLQATMVPKPRRLSAVLQSLGLNAFQSAAAPFLTRDSARAIHRGRAEVIGRVPGAWYGLAFPFGVVSADGLLRLADAVENCGSGDIRVLPSRTVLLANAGPETAALLQAAGGIGRNDDPRLRIEACSGLGACPVATTPTRGDALALAERVPGLLSGGAGGCALHVSGCAKGCAHSGSALVTLTGNGGRYDLSLMAAAGSAPVWRGLTLDEAAARLNAVERSVEAQRAQDEKLEATMKRLGAAGLRRLSGKETAGA